MKIKPLRALAAAVGTAAVILGGAAFLNWQMWGLEVTHTPVPVSGLPQGFEGMRIVHLSDLHGHRYGEDHRELLELVAQQEPELIALTGDVIDRASQRDILPALARGLSRIAPTYYVTGNHEWAVGDVGRTKDILEENGVTVLSNQYTLLERGGDQVVLAGVDDPNGYADQKTPGELYEEIHTTYPGLCTLLLAHRNNYFDQYAACGYDLVLAGHAHGGLVRLPLTDGVIGPGRQMFPTWTAGVYTLGESTLFSTRGLGNNTTPIPGFRLFNRPEISVLELVAARQG